MLTSLKVSSLACKFVFHRLENETQKWKMPAHRAQRAGESFGHLSI